MRLLLVPGAFLAITFAWPLANMLGAGFDAQAWRWMAGPFVQSKLGLAFLQAVLSTVATLLIAIPLAILHQRKIWGSKWILALHAAPFVLPVFVVVLGIRTVFGTDGWIDQSLGLDLIGTSGLAAVVVAHAYYNYGFAARILHGALARRPRVLEAAAATLGASPKSTTWRITVPLLAPALASVALLVFLFSFTSFGVVLYLGGPVETLETLLYENLRGAFSQPERAAVLGLSQLALNVMLVAAYAWLARRQKTWVPDRQSGHAGTAQSVAAWALLALPLAPLVAVLSGAFRVQGVWSTAAWQALLSPTHAGHLPGFNLVSALGLSMAYAAASAALALGLTICLAYGSEQLSHGRRVVVDALTALPLGTSSLLIGFGMILTFGISGFTNTWSGRLLVVLAHALIAFPFTVRALLPAFESRPQALDHAAATLGASRWSTAWLLHWPLLRRPAQVAVGFALAMSLGDFGASLLLQNAENRSLAVWIDAHGVSSFDPLRRAQATALAAVLMVLSLGALVAVEQAEANP